MCTGELVGQGRLTTILTNKVNGTRDEANISISLKLSTLETCETKTIIFLASLMTEIEMVSLVVKRP